ncbi:MAG: hypothetical protein R3B54_08710 [Bdellovibrionota bacterium]
MRKWLKPTLPKAFAVSALAVVYAWVDSTPTPEIPKVRKVEAPVVQLQQPAEPAAKPSAALFLDSVAPAPKPAKKIRKQASRAKKRVPRAKKKSPVPIAKKPFVPAAALAELVENELLSDPALPSLAALNVTGPLDNILEEALDETPRTPLFHPDQLVASAEMDADFWLEDTIPTYKPVQLAVMSRVIAQSFEENKETVETAKQEAADLVTIQAPPAIEPVEPKLEKAPALPLVAEAPKVMKKTEPVVAAKVPEKVEPPVTVAKVEAPKAVETVRPQVVEPQAPKVSAAPPTEEVAPVEVAVAPTQAEIVEAPVEEIDQEEEITEILNTEKNQLIAAEESDELDSQEMTTQNPASSAPAALAPMLATPVQPIPVPAPKIELPKKAPAPPVEVARENAPSEEVAKTVSKPSTAVAALRPQRAAAASTKTGVIDGKLEGRFRVGPRLKRWLTEKGHAEIFLHPTGSRDPQDNVHLGTIHAGENFQLARQDLVGEYRLYARFFSRKSSSLRAEIAYPEPIAPDNYKALIDFYVSDKEYRDAIVRKRRSGSRSSVITIPIFETAGGSEADPLRGDFRTPQPIPKARLTVLGFEEWGSFEADANGNVRIPNVPSRSELLVRAQAEGFVPTMKLLTVADNGSHVPIYMLSQSKLPAIRYYTQTDQQKDKALVLGRSFDPTSRTPLAGETLKMSFRKSDALYFSEYQPENAAELGIFNAWTAMFLGAIPDVALKATTDLGLFAFMNVTGSYRGSLAPRQTGASSRIYIQAILTILSWPRRQRRFEGQACGSVWRENPRSSDSHRRGQIVRSLYRHRQPIPC